VFVECLGVLTVDGVGVARFSLIRRVIGMS
jgi:hypothetical protein